MFTPAKKKRTSVMGVDILLKANFKITPGDVIDVVQSKYPGHRKIAMGSI